MLYNSKDHVGSWLLDYFFHYRKLNAQTRKDLEKGAISKGTALRNLSRVVSSAALLSDYCQKHLIAMTNHKLPAQFRVAGSDGNVYDVGLVMDINSILTSFVSNREKEKELALMQGDYFAAFEQSRLIRAALECIGDDDQGRFRIIAHHPSLMKRMAAFAGKNDSINRTFTLSIDNDMAVSAGKVYFRRPWMALPVSHLNREFVETKAALVADDARLLAEKMVEQGCYTDSPVLNGLLVLFSEASQLKHRAESMVQKISREIQGSMAKYDGYRSFGKQMRQKEAFVTQVEPGILAISGAPITSVKSVQRANFPVIKSLINSRVASVEVQQMQFRSTMRSKSVDTADINWDTHMSYAVRNIMDNLKASHERLRKERTIMRDLKMN